MKQKIVLKVACNKCKRVGCDKCRRRALKIAVTVHGVSSVSLEGADKDQVVVIGDGVDPVCLGMALRKKCFYAEIKKVEEVKDEPKKKEKEKEKEEPKPKDPLPCCYVSYPPCPPCVVYDPYDRNCIIL